MASPTLKLPYIAEGQAQPHVTHNEALEILDAALSGTVKSATTASTPTAPGNGDAYILPPGATGFGGGAAGEIAIWSGGLWHRTTPPRAARFHVADEGRCRVFDGTAWQPGDVLGLAGSRLGLRTIEAQAILAGASVTVGGIIPARAILLGVTSWVIDAVTGAASFSVGTPGSPTQFGSGLGGAGGSSNVGVIGPVATYAVGDVILTAAGGSFTGGRVGLAVAVILPGAPA